jgi:hypothetical protein
VRGSPAPDGGDQVTTTMVVGASTRPGTEEAAADAVAQVLAGAPAPQLALVLATDDHDPAVLARVVGQALGGVPWAGCCAAGVFSGPRLLEHGVVVGGISAPGARVGIGVSDAVGQDGRRAGATAAVRALEALPPVVPGGWSRALLVFSEASVGNAADVVRGALEVGGTGAIWAGAGVGNRGRRAGSAQLALGQAHSDSVVVIALDTPGRLAAAISHGFRPYGPPTLVTRAHGAVAAELEYEPAFPVYQRTALARGDLVSPETFSAFAVTHPLGIPRADGEHVIRDPMDLDAEGGLRCSAEVPDGSLIRVMEGDPAALLAAARHATDRARGELQGPIAGAVVFDCISRQALLGATFADELQIFAEALPLVGCLSHGEIGALGRGGPQYHNKTAVVMALGR